MFFCFLFVLLLCTFATSEKLTFRTLNEKTHHMITTTTTSVTTSADVFAPGLEAVDFIADNYTYIINQLDVSELSRVKYRKDAAAFIDFIKSNGLHMNTFRQYKQHLKALTTISTKTKNYKLVAAKALLKELYARYKLLPVDLTAGVKCFTVSQQHTKDGLTAEEVKALQQYIDGCKDQAKRARLKAMLYLFAFQGLRQAEVCSLTVEDLRLNDSQLLVLGKGRDDKEAVDLHPGTVSALTEYLTAFNVRSGHLFFSLSRNKSERLSERSVRRLFAELFTSVGIPADRSVHGFRHYFVTAMLTSKAFDLFEIQKFTRHKSVQTLQKYDDRKKKRELLPAFYSCFA